MAASPLHHHMERSQRMFMPQTQGVYLGGGGPCGVLPTGVEVSAMYGGQVNEEDILTNKTYIVFMYRHWKVKNVILQEGPEPLPQCDRCGVHILAARLWRHKRMASCYRAMDMRLRQRDLEMAERLGEMEFSLYGREGVALMEGWISSNTLGVPCIKRNMTGHWYSGTSNGS